MPDGRNYPFCKLSKLMAGYFCRICAGFSWGDISLCRFLMPAKRRGLAGLAIGFIVAGILCSAFQYYSHSHPVLSKVETVRIQAVIEDLAYRPTGRLHLHLRHLDKDETIFASLREIRVTIATDHLFQAGDRIDAEMVLFPLSLPAFAGR